MMRSLAQRSKSNSCTAAPAAALEAGNLPISGSTGAVLKRSLLTLKEIVGDPESAEGRAALPSSTKARRSALITSARVVAMPCGNPL